MVVSLVKSYVAVITKKLAIHHAPLNFIIATKNALCLRINFSLEDTQKNKIIIAIIIVVIIVVIMIKTKVIVVPMA